MNAVDTCATGQSRGSSVRLEHINHCKRQIARVRGQSARASLARLFPRAGLRGRGGKFAQQRQLPFADDALSVVAVGAEYAADRTVVVRNRAVGESIIGLFRVAV